MKQPRRTAPAPSVDDPDVPTSVPVAVRPRFAEVVRLTDAVCRDALDEEYARLARKAAEVMARKRPSPLLGGRVPGWACGIVYALGRVNFLFDKSFDPYLSAGDLCARFGVSAATGAAKAREVEHVLKAGVMDPRWSVPAVMARNPMAWLVQVNGFVMDARDLPRKVQEDLVERGIIPYVHDGEDRR
jgi:hypothetical protein